MTSTFLYLIFLSVGSLASILSPRQSSSNTAVIDLGGNNGPPKHLASGFIYGIPDVGFGQSPTQIPDYLYTQMGFNYARAGGAQTTQGGWIDGISAYKARFASTLQNYQTTRKYGGRFQILPHDLWGTDHTNSSSIWPGDNGDWTNYDQFLTQLASDLQANNMLSGLDMDIWNEPDGGFFWQRSNAQYYQLWTRSYQHFRSITAFKSVLMVGPSSAGSPTSGNSFWNGFLQNAVSTKTIPDQYTWHTEPGSIAGSVAGFGSLLSANNAPSRTININEYGTFDQQCSTGAAYQIAQLERANAIGLRGNWLSTCQLHDFMGSLVYKSDTSCGGVGYYPNGEWQVYKYYSSNMTGYRAQTSSTGDGVMDVYTTVGSDKVRTLTGVNLKTGTWYITINNLSAVGLPTSGTLNIQTWGFDWKGHNTQVSAPSNRGIYGHSYSGNTVTFPVFQTTQDANTAWAFEFSV